MWYVQLIAHNMRNIINDWGTNILNVWCFYIYNVEEFVPFIWDKNYDSASIGCLLRTEFIWTEMFMCVCARGQAKMIIRTENGEGTMKFKQFKNQNCRSRMHFCLHLLWFRIESGVLVPVPWIHGFWSLFCSTSYAFMTPSRRIF